MSTSYFVWSRDLVRVLVDFSVVHARADVALGLALGEFTVTIPGECY